MPDDGPPSAAEPSVWLTFTGPTALVRAHHLLRAAGQRCAITAAPTGQSPCGLALAVPRDAVEAALLTLRALGAAPHGMVAPEPQHQG